KALEKTMAYTLVPVNWHYREQVSGEKMSFTVSEQPADQHGEIDLGLTVNITRKVPDDIHEAAKTKYEEMTSLAKEMGTSRNQTPVFEQQMMVAQIGKRFVYTMVAANVKTNTLITVTFECPMDQWQTVWEQTGQVMISRLIFNEAM
ncbi:MAG: hypothetical protein ACKV2V_00920, partial [Blastocatellia bacterium]